MVMGSNFGLNKINFLFAKHYFWHECERMEETLTKGTTKVGLKTI